MNQIVCVKINRREATMKSAYNYNINEYFKITFEKENDIFNRLDSVKFIGQDLKEVSPDVSICISTVENGSGNGNWHIRDYSGVDKYRAKDLIDCLSNFSASKSHYQMSVRAYD